MNKMADQLHYSIRDFRDILLGELTKLEFGAREHMVNSLAVNQSRFSAIQESVQTQESVNYERENKKLRKEIFDLTDQLTHHEKNDKNRTIVNDLESVVESLNRQLKKAEHENHALHCDSDQIASKYNILEKKYVELEKTHNDLLKTQSELEKTQLDLKKENASLSEKNHQLEQGKLKEKDDVKENTVKENEKHPIDVLGQTVTVTHPLLGKIQVPVSEEKSAEPEPMVEENEEINTTVDPSTLSDFTYKGVTYKRDTDNTLYSESKEGWEIIGTWDEKTKAILIEEEEIEAEEEAEEDVEEEVEPELTEFLFKGKTYFLDEENAVFQETEEGYEEVGTWNGKKILFLA